ncbi:hypothetical protein [Croceicoccus hydrothermalis]|uniref:hypothetical protein n=1 Tax=Croceicoccus hydrothermalis TaxID=2867964 RepID=UPI001EFB5356|nr:hypothetical protein [Croceicoccus hydrothermalis]
MESTLAFARLASQAEHISRLSLSHPNDIEIVRAYISELEYLRKCEILAPSKVSVDLPNASVEFMQMADNLKMAFPVCRDEELENLALQLFDSEVAHE